MVVGVDDCPGVLGAEQDRTKSVPGLSEKNVKQYCACTAEGRPKFETVMLAQSPMLD